MKIIVPEFVLALLSSPTCDLVHRKRVEEMCDIVTIDASGNLSGDPDGAEVVMLPWLLPDEVVARLLRMPSVRWLQTVSSGTEYAQRVLSPEQEMLVTNASGVFDIPIAEMVLTYILMVTKQVPRFLEQQRSRRWHLVRLREVAGLTVAIVGLGSIGIEVARRCRAFGMRVLATRRHPSRGGEGVDVVYAAEQLSEMLQTADFVVISAPLTSETRGMIGRDELAQMRPDAWLINVARGPIVDQDALIAALASGTIGGAALDVFDVEPLPETSPLWDMPNVIITPHNSWSTPYLERRETELFLDNLVRYLRGELLRNVVDRSSGY
jgi:phosphoglycerate dehydrogenase-like enzyme